VRWALVARIAERLSGAGSDRGSNGVQRRTPAEQNATALGREPQAVQSDPVME